MPREREYADNAERQRAYRERKRAEEERLREEMRRLRGEDVTRGSRQGRRVTDDNLRTLARMLAIIMHPATEPPERNNTIGFAHAMIERLGLSWYDVLGVAERPRRL